jgi:IclR family transcriptional regulator, KDG regulon repressor
MVEYNNMLQHKNASSNNDTNINPNNDAQHDVPGYVLSTTVLKALHLLEFIAANQPVHAPAICKGLGMTRANVHRLLATLISAGYIEKLERGYEITFKLFQLGSTVPLNKDLRDVAKPVMNDFEQLAHENIYLNVLTEDVVIAIDEVKSPHHVVLNPDVTFTYPVNTCASGKVLLSSYGEDELRAYIDSMEMVKRTEYTITDREQFLKEVLNVRENGFAFEIMEFSSDLNSMAAPIYDHNQRVVATISISGPAMRLTQERLQLLIDPLKEKARIISNKLIDNTRFFFTEKKGRHSVRSM